MILNQIQTALVGSTEAKCILIGTYKIWEAGSPVPVLVDVINGNITGYSGSASRVYSLDLDKWWFRTVGGNYTEYGIYAEGKPQDPYVGELALDSGHEWEYTANGWVDLGEVHSGGSLPVDVFSLNYNAKHMDGNTFLREEGQLVDADATINGSSYTINDGYVTIGNTTAGNTYCAVGGFQTYMNRNNNNPEITIISKAKTNPEYYNHYSLLCNRGSSYNWMWRPYRNKLCLHGSSGEMGNLSIPQGEVVIGSARVNSNRQLILNDWSNGTTNTTNSFSYGSLERSGFAMFRDYYNNTNEPWSGDFYWVFMCQSTLTDEEVQQVIQYNEEGGIEYVKEYEALTVPQPTGTTYVTADNEYIKSGSDYYAKDYIYNVYQGGGEENTGTYVQGEELEKEYVQGEASDFMIYDGGRYYKNYIYVTPTTVQLATGDYVRGDYIGAADILVSGLTSSSSDFTVKINNTDEPAKIIGTEGSLYKYVVYGDLTASVTSLDNFAQSNSNIRSCHMALSFSGTLTNAFQNCQSLTAVTIPSNVTGIGTYCFRNCFNLTGVTLPNSVTTIGINAFVDCRSIVSLELPSSLTTISGSTFDGCTSLTGITLPASVTSIKSSVFKDCSSLTSITVDANNTTFDSRGNCNAIIITSNNTLRVGCKSTVIPDTVTAIEYCAFIGTAPNVITIPSSVTNIGDEAFDENTNTVYHFEGTSPCTIGSRVFRNGYGVIFVPAGYGETYKTASNWSVFADRIYEEGASFATKDITGTYTGTGAVTTTFGTRSEVNAYYYDTDKFFFNVPANATQIGYDNLYAISTNVTSIDLSNATTLRSIGNYLFYNNQVLTAVTIGSYITSIGREAFRNSPSLDSITIPSNITSMDSQVLDGCKAVVHMASSTPCTITSGTFNENRALIYVPVGCGETYKTASNWTNFADKIYEEGETFATAPVKGTFVEDVLLVVGYFNLSQVFGDKYDAGKFIMKPPADGTNIGHRLLAYRFTSSITSIDLSNLPSSYVTVSNNAFYQHNGITTVILPNTITTIGANSFRECSALTSITIPASVTQIQGAAFYYTNADIHMASTTPCTISSDTFQLGSGTIYVPVGCGETYKTASNWTNFADRIVEEGTSV